MNRYLRFVDAGYWIALANVRDDLHQRARLLARSLPGSLITTEAVLLEVGASLARLATRGAATNLLLSIRAQPAIDVVALSPELLSRAFALYAARPDKEWGLTDYISFVEMQDRGITEALAADQHFVQAGFRALLRE